MPTARVGNLSPARQQRIISSVRAGQAKFNRMYANMRREEQIANNINKLQKNRQKLIHLQIGRRGVHPEGSNANHRNNVINARLVRNRNRKIQEIRRLEAELIAIRRRLLRPTLGAALTNANVLTGVNFATRKAEINRMRQKRLARLIEHAYFKPGGIFSRKSRNNFLRNVAARQ